MLLSNKASYTWDYHLAFAVLSLTYFIITCNLLWVFMITRNRNRFPPPMGPTSAVLQRLQMNIMSRRSRWSRIGLTATQLCICIVIDVAELTRTGYHAKLIIQAWHASAASDRYFAVSLRILYLTLRSKPLLSCPWLISKELIDTILDVHGIRFVAQGPSCYPQQSRQAGCV